MWTTLTFTSINRLSSLLSRVIGMTNRPPLPLFHLFFFQTSNHFVKTSPRSLDGVRISTIWYPLSLAVWSPSTTDQISTILFVSLGNWDSDMDLVIWGTLLSLNITHIPPLYFFFAEFNISYNIGQFKNYITQDFEVFLYWKYVLFSAIKYQVSTFPPSWGNNWWFTNLSRSIRPNCQYCFGA